MELIGTLQEYINGRLADLEPSELDDNGCVPEEEELDPGNVEAIVDSVLDNDQLRRSVRRAVVQYQAWKKSEG